MIYVRKIKDGILEFEYQRYYLAEESCSTTFMQILIRYFPIVPKVIPHQAEACESPKAKQTHSTMDPFEDW